MKTLILTIAITVALSGCVTSRASQVDADIAAAICHAFPPVTYDGKLDTPETKDQIKKNNAKRAAFCNPNKH